MRKPSPELQYLLQTIFNDQDAIDEWLNFGRLEWYGLSPMDAIQLGKDRAVINLLRSLTEGEISGQ